MYPVEIEGINLRVLYNLFLKQYDIIGTDNAEEEYLTIAVKQNPDDGYVNNKPEHHSFRY